MAGHKEAPHISYRRRSVSESDHDVFDPLFQGSLITLIADLIPNLILLAAGYNKNVDHISILNNKVLFVKKNVDKITLEISEKVNQFKTWINNMKASNNNMEIPQSIAESIQEIITNSSPGLAVTEIRGEFETLRGEVMSGKHMMEMLRGLVTKLKLQMDSNSSQD